MLADNLSFSSSRRTSDLDRCTVLITRFFTTLPLTYPRGPRQYRRQYDASSSSSSGQDNYDDDKDDEDC